MYPLDGGESLNIVISAAFYWISPYHPEDGRGGWKGMQFHLLRCLEQKFGPSDRIAPIEVPEELVCKWISRIKRQIGLPRPYVHYSERRLRKYAQTVEMRLVGNTSLPVVFFGPLPFVYCCPKAPFYIYTDGAFFIHYWEYNQDHTHLKSEIERICRAEAEFMRASSGVWCSSQWVADRITSEYCLPDGLVRAVGSGPGISPPTVATIVYEPSLVMIAADFVRKRGRLAVEAVAEARKLGANVRLKIIGECPPDDVLVLPYVDWCGWLNLSNPADRCRFGDILSHAGAQILVSRSDLTPLVIPEAASYSKATIATDVGGIPEMIQDGVTGWLCGVDAGAGDIGRLIADVFSDLERLESAGRAAQRFCGDKWSWGGVAGKCVAAMVTKS